MFIISIFWCNIESETIDCTELIYIYKQKETKFFLNGFYSRWKNGIDLAGIAGIDAAYKNISKKESFGVEATAMYAFKSLGITPDIGFAWVKSERLDDPDPDNPAEKTDLEFVAFPDYSIIAGIHYAAPFGIQFYLNNRIYLGMKEPLDPFQPFCASENFCISRK